MSGYSIYKRLVHGLNDTGDTALSLGFAYKLGWLSKKEFKHALKDVGAYYLAEVQKFCLNRHLSGVSQNICVLGVIPWDQFRTVLEMYREQGREYDEFRKVEICLYQGI